MTQAKFDLTEGQIFNKLLLIALPIMGTQLFQMAFNLSDMFFLGRISSDAVAASGTAGMFMWLSTAFFIIGRMGAEIGVSQSLGKKDLVAAQKFSQSATFIAIILGVTYATVLILFGRPLISFFQIQEAHVVNDAIAYLTVIAIGMPMNFVSFSINGTFTGSGNARFPFAVNASGLILNIILSPIFIFTLDMGIYGAAIATVISQTLVCITFIIAIKKHPSRPFETYKYGDIFKVKKDYIKQIFKWAIPISLESFCFTVLTMIISRMIAEFGAGAIATYRVGSQVESLSWLIGGGFASALTAFVGQNFGAEKWGRIHKGFRISVLIMTVWGTLVTLALIFGGRQLFGLFISEPEIIELGVDYLRIFSVIQLVTCLEAIAAGAFRGVGKTQPPSIVAIIFNVLRVFFALLLSSTELGLNGIWWGMTLGNLFRGIILFGWYWLYARKQPRVDKEMTTLHAL